MVQNNESGLGAYNKIIGLLESPNRGDRLVAVEKFLGRPINANSDLSLVAIAAIPTAARLRLDAMREVVRRTQVRVVGEPNK